MLAFNMSINDLFLFSLINKKEFIIKINAGSIIEVSFDIKARIYIKTERKILDFIKNNIPKNINNTESESPRLLT